MASILSAGTTSATAMVHTADTSGVLQLASNNGTVALTVDTSQNVGIGTTSPPTKLAVYGGSINVDRNVGGGASQLLMTLGASSGSNFGQISNTGTYWALGYGSSQSTVGTQSVVWDSSGNVGIGSTSPTNKLQVLANGTSYQIRATGDGSGAGYVAYTNSEAFACGVGGTTGGGFGAGLGFVGTLTNQPLLIVTNGTEKARIDSSGNLLIGKTSQSGSEGIALVRPANTATYIYMLKNTQLEMTMGAKSSTDTNFYVGTGSSSVGTYGVYLTNTGNSWNAVSDERQKNIIESIDNGLEKVSTLRAVIGSYKNDPKEIRRPFLIAQDVQAVLPEAVNIQDEETGTLGMSYTDVIPLLVASIKELKAINDQQAETINALTARVVALENK